jgi:hypothetical protein
VARVLPLLAALLVFGCADSRITAGRHSSTAPSNAHLPKQSWPKLPHCPRDAANCSAARGTILYVEAVDPDGDGDAHFVLTSDQSITFPGISVIDVKKSLRPHPLPGVGERIAAAGPVYRGSHGQRQIEATVLRVAGQR